MLITLSVDAKGWGGKTKREYEKAVKMMAFKLAQSIKQDPERFKPEK